MPDSQNNSLEHYGILGMRWGRRKASSSSSSDNDSPDHKSVSSLRKKKVSEMSNDELKKLTARLQLERQLKDLTKTDASAGQKFVSEVLLGVGKQMAIKYVSQYASSGVESLLKRATG